MVTRIGDKKMSKKAIRQIKENGKVWKAMEKVIKHETKVAKGTKVYWADTIR